MATAGQDPAHSLEEASEDASHDSSSVDDNNARPQSSVESSEEVTPTYLLTFPFPGTKSLRPFDIQNVFENSRQYCNSTYFMPNDESEQTRLSILHQIYLLILAGRLTRATLSPNVSRVLDIGTGPGYWAIDMADKYPSAEIVATDISVFQLQQGDNRVPPNVSFEIDDVEEDWTFPQNSFDLIHLRDMSGSISHWRFVYREALKCLVPGGQIEVSDFGEFDTSTTTTATTTTTSNLTTGNTSSSSAAAGDTSSSHHEAFISALRSAAETANTSLSLDHLDRNVLEEIGYTDIRHVLVRVPVGTWPRDAQRKTVGKMMLIGVLEGLEARGLRLLTKYKGWTADEVRELIEKVKEEIRSLDGRPNRFIPFHIVVAAKPGAS